MKMFKKIIPAVMFGVVYAALIVVGWGIDDISGFFSHPARTILFAVTITVNTLTMFFKDRFGIEFDKKGEKVDPGEKLTGVMLPSLIGFLIVLVAPYSESHNLLVMGSGDILRSFGLIVFLLGYLFMVWAPLHLGKQFSAYITIQEGHELITDGPFRYMRHPRYSGLVCWVFGVAMVFLSGPGLVLAAMMSVLMLIRIPKEERLLYGEFDKEWKDYCRRTTKKLIPFVY
jgi:protein-S-isoprenylcysteine O-methyltransferase Ste14